MINFSTSTFNRIILHKIIKKQPGEAHATVDLEDQIVDANDEVHTIIKKRIVEACGKQSKSFRLFIEKYGEGSFFSLANELHSLDEPQFIEKSKNIASLLGQAQRRPVNGGYLIVIEGIAFSGSKFVVVIKAELQNAFSRNKNAETNRNQIEVITDLFLSPSNKFFKIGYIYERQDGDEVHPNDAWGSVIFDDQFSPQKAPADYFISAFLGFSLSRNLKFINKDFFAATRQVIVSNSSASAAEKNQAITALVTVFKDNTQKIDPIEFGTRFLPDSFKEDYENSVLSDTRFDRPFARRTELIKSDLNKKSMTFEHKVKIQGPEEHFDNTVKIVTSIDEAQTALDDTTLTLLQIKGKPFHG
jgi:hypothetical protein